MPGDREVRKNKEDMLTDKVNLLADKIENERNPIKRMIYSIKAKMVISKLNRQIAIENIRNEYDKEIQNANGFADDLKSNTRDDIISVVEEIEILEDELRANRKFNPESKYFIFGREDGAKYRDSYTIEENINNLKNSGSEKQKEVAERIEDYYRKRSILEEKKKKLEELQGNFENIDNQAEQTIKKKDKEEKSLIKKEKGTIFTRIAEFFRNVRYGIQEVIEERQDKSNINKTGRDEQKQNKENMQKVKQQQKEQKKNDFRKLIADIKVAWEDYRKDRAYLDEEYRSANEQIKTNMDNQIGGFVEDKARQQANKFRGQIKQMAQRGDSEVEDPYFGNPIFNGPEREEEDKIEEPNI